MSPAHWTVDGPQIIDVPDVTALDATILNGRLDVVAHDDPAVTTARIEVHTVEGRPLEIWLEGGLLRIGSDPLLGWRGFVETFRGYSGKDRADVHIALPLTAHARVRTVKGEALVAGVRSGARVATVSGSLVTARTRGALRVDTVSGDVTVSDHEGDVTMDSVSGELTATGRLGGVRADSVSGNITLDTLTTPTSVAVTVVSSDVLMRVPDPNELDFDVRCVSGRLLIDGSRFRARSGATVLPADDGPGRPARINAISGNVTVLRAEVSAPADGEPAVAMTGTEDL